MKKVENWNNNYIKHGFSYTLEVRLNDEVVEDNLEVLVIESRYPRLFVRESKVNSEVRVNLLEKNNKNLIIEHYFVKMILRYII